MSRLSHLPVTLESKGKRFQDNSGLSRPKQKPYIVPAPTHYYLYLRGCPHYLISKGSPDYTTVELFVVLTPEVSCTLWRMLERGGLLSRRALLLLSYRQTLDGAELTDYVKKIKRQTSLLRNDRLEIPRNRTVYKQFLIIYLFFCHLVLPDCQSPRVHFRYPEDWFITVVVAERNQVEWWGLTGIRYKKISYLTVSWSSS